MKGEKIGFIGKTGSDKTTLPDLIIGLLKPSNGKILIDGNDLYNDIKLRESSFLSGDQMAYVPQTIFLSDSTIKENIIFGFFKINLMKIFERICQNIISSPILPKIAEGLDTITGEGGIRLSGGQRHASNCKSYL